MPFQTWEELELTAYGAFRKTEAEHVAETYGKPDTAWANVSDWERFHMDAYDAALVPNGTGAHDDAYGWYY